MYQRSREETRFVSLSVVFRDYRRTRKLSPRSVLAYDFVIRKCLADWLDRDITTITKDEVVQRHFKITHTDGNPTEANVCMRLLRALFNFAIANYDLPILNPVKQLSVLKVWNEEKIRQNYVKPRQLERWFQDVLALENETQRDLILLLIFTGLRRGEATNMLWEDVDFEDRSFTVRGTKNGTDHSLPMSDFVYGLLRLRYLSRKESRYVFPGKYPNTPISPTTCITRIDGVSGFTFHDLRRTFLTIAESLDFQPYLLKRLANHKLSASEITFRYVIRDVDRLREPMQRISDRILQYAKLELLTASDEILQ